MHKAAARLVAAASLPLAVRREPERIAAAKAGQTVAAKVVQRVEPGEGRVAVKQVVT